MHYFHSVMCLGRNAIHGLAFQRFFFWNHLEVGQPQPSTATDEPVLNLTDEKSPPKAVPYLELSFSLEKSTQ